MKRKNQLIQVEDCSNIKKVKLCLTTQTKRCSDEYDDYNLGGASDEDVCEYDRKKRLKINNGVIYTFKRTITKNKNNIPSYIN
jgi:hypothetical protein